MAYKVGKTARKGRAAPTRKRKKNPYVPKGKAKGRVPRRIKKSVVGTKPTIKRKSTRGRPTKRKKTSYKPGGGLAEQGMTDVTIKKHFQKRKTLDSITQKFKGMTPLQRKRYMTRMMQERKRKNNKKAGPPSYSGKG